MGMFAGLDDELPFARRLVREGVALYLAKTKIKLTRSSSVEAYSSYIDEGIKTS